MPGHGQAPGRHLRGPGQRVLGVPQAHVPQVGVGAGTQSPPVGVQPVGAVVAALVAGTRPVGDLVPLVARLGQGSVGHLVLGGLVVVLRHGQVTAAHLAPHACALLDDQGVGTEVVRFHGHGCLQAHAPVLQGLPGRAVDEVEARVQAGPSCPGHHLGHPLGPVCAVQGGQDAGDGGLHPEADPCEAARGEGRQGGLVHGLGVGLGGDLGAVGQTPGPAHGVQQSHELGGAQHGGRATTHEHGLGGAGRQPGSRHGGVGQTRLGGQGGRVVGSGGARPHVQVGVGVEVAVTAAHPAVGHVDVDAEGPQPVRACHRARRRRGPHLLGQLPEARQGRTLGLGGAHGALTVLPVKSARCPTAGGCVRR